MGGWIRESEGREGGLAWGHKRVCGATHTWLVLKAMPLGEVAEVRAIERAHTLGVSSMQTSKVSKHRLMAVTGRAWCPGCQRETGSDLGAPFTCAAEGRTVGVAP